MPKISHYSPELRERAVMMVNDNRQDYDWSNNRRIHESLDYVPPVEFETGYHHSNESESLAVLEMI